jgi:inorganic pyrophosphatase
MVDVTQRKPSGRIANPRLIVIPTWFQLPDGEISELSAQFKQEIANFFETAGYFAGSDPKIEGWRSAIKANKHIEASIR